MKKVLKKIFATIISIILLILTWTLIVVLISDIFVFMEDIPKYKFGKFKKEIKIPKKKFAVSYMRIPYNGVVKLKNENILILGRQYGENISGNNPNSKTIIKIPTYLYDIKTNKIREIELPENIMYSSEGIMYDDKLLLLNVYDNNKANIPPKRVGYSFEPCPYIYNLMAVINLKDLKAEKIINKKMNKSYNYNWDNTLFLTSYALLDKDKLIMVDVHSKMIEIFDLKNDTSELITNINIPTCSHSTTLSYNDKVIIFCDDTNNEFTNSKFKVYEFDITNKTLKPIKELSYTNLNLVKYLDKEKGIILIFHDGYKIKLYNIRTKQLIFDHELKTFCNPSTVNAELINDNLIFFGWQKFFGGKSYFPFVLNMKTLKINYLPRQKILIDRPATIKLDNQNIIIYDRNINVFKPSKIITKNQQL